MLWYVIKFKFNSELVKGIGSFISGYGTIGGVLVIYEATLGGICDFTYFQRGYLVVGGIAFVWICIKEFRKIILV